MMPKPDKRRSGTKDALIAAGLTVAIATVNTVGGTIVGSIIDETRKPPTSQSGGRSPK